MLNSKRPDAAERLADLETRVARALDYLGDRPADRMPRCDGIDKDVVIVGAGQAGLAIGFALKREGLRNFVLLDAAPAGEEGPWRTFARMETLRSPKEIPGPELGIADLTYRAWHEAVFGAESYEAVYKIPTGLWMDYLLWYRAQIDVPIENGVQVSRVEPCEGGLRLELCGSGDGLTTRKLVLATGMDGFGQAHVPEFIRVGLPRDRYATCAEDVDFSALAGRGAGCGLFRFRLCGGGAGGGRPPG